MVFVGGVEGAVALRPLGHLGCRLPFVKKNVPPEYPAVSLPPAHSADVGQILCIPRHDLPIIGRRQAVTTLPVAAYPAVTERICHVSRAGTGESNSSRRRDLRAADGGISLSGLTLRQRLRAAAHGIE
jgi:hypothetical protein